MWHSRAFIRVWAVAAAGILLTGCITGTLVEVATDPLPQSRHITRVTGATLAGDRVYIRIDAEREGGRPETLIVEIPLDDLERAGKPEAQGLPGLPGVASTRPPERAVRRAHALPREGTSLPIETLDLQRIEDLSDLSGRLGPGVHVVSIQASPDIAGLKSRFIPALLDTRDGREPVAVGIAELPPALKSRKSLLLLLPFTVAGDAITLPFQVFVAILNGGC